jgi:hypothetical protein
VPNLLSGGLQGGAQTAPVLPARIRCQRELDADRRMILNVAGRPSTHVVQRPQAPRGEVGILKGVVLSNINPTDRCFLYINYQQSTYTG